MPQPTWRERAPEIQKMLDEGKSYGEIADFYGAKRHVLRSKLKQLRDKGLISYENRETHHDEYVAKQASGETPRIPPDAKREIDRHGHERKIDWESGGHYSKKLVWMSDTQDKDEEFLLKAHGYDPKVFKVTSSTSKIWNGYSKLHGIFTLFSSTITVKKRSAQDWSIDDLLKAIKEGVGAVTIDVPIVHLADKRLLEVGCVDTHFGNSTYELYKHTQRRIYELLNSRRWADVLFYVGHDVFHNDNFRGQTANGTQIEVVNMPNAWIDADMFFSVLIETALRQSDEVHIKYVKSNHDESLAWAFLKYLQAKYPQAVFDDSVQERKIHCFGNVFIGITHGDKARKQLHNLFPVEFPLEWSQAKTRELHCGHLHVEDAKDVFGMMVRTLATRNKTDSWHRDNGFVGAHKRFQVFEYSTDELEAIHYV